MRESKRGLQEAKTIIQPAESHDLSVLSIEMQEIIQRAYTLFGQYKTPKTFSVCDCPCCMYEEHQFILQTTPLAQLPANTLYEYNNAARTVLESDFSEVFYLLPRVLELIALHAEIHHSVELYLQKVADADISLWKKEEREIFNDFALQYMHDLFIQAENKSELVYLTEPLIMFHLGGIDVTPLLNIMSDVTEFYGIASIARLVFDEREDCILINSFASDQPEFNQMINNWLNEASDQLKANAEMAILNVPESFSNLSESERYFIEQNLFYTQDYY